MRVLHLTAPAPYGGLEQVVHALAAGSAARGEEVAVAAVLEPGGPPGEHPFVAGLRRDGVEVHPLVLPGRAYLREWRGVRRLCRGLRPDVVHTHGYRCDVLHAAAVREDGLPVATTVHGFTGGGGRLRAYEWLQRASLRRFDAVVAVSRALGGALRGAGVPAERLRVIPNAWSGRAPALSRAAARQTLGAAEDEVVVGWVGRLSPEKGADVLLDALPLVPGVCAHFVGSGPEAGALRERAARLGVAGRVRWHGALPGAGTLFPAFDAFVLSSRTEGTPVALFEAIAADVPVVAARVGGVPDVVDDATARLVPPCDPAALAAALREVRESPVAARARAAAARVVLDHRFGAGPWLDAYRALYREIRSRRPRPR